MFYDTDLIAPEDLPEPKSPRILPLWEQIRWNKLREADDLAESEEATWD